MGIQYTVRRGDHLTLLAQRHRLPNWQAIYNHPRNADFRRRRPNPDLIMPGDQLFIPTPGEVGGQPGGNPQPSQPARPGGNSAPVVLGRVKRAIATLSWIDPATGLPEVDAGGDPGRRITRQQILGEVIYRFSNFLEAWVEIAPAPNPAGTGARIVAGDFARVSGMYQSPSFAGLDSAPVGNIGRRKTVTPDRAVFRQLVGCRTESPERIAEITGGVVGGVIAGPLGGYVGSRVGREVVEEVQVFPPIWTEVELTIHSDGSFLARLVRHSKFPSVSFYAEDIPAGQTSTRGDPNYARQGPSYDAVPHQSAWESGGWGPAPAGSGGPTDGNPWGMSSPAGLGSGTTPNIQPAGY